MPQRYRAGPTVLADGLNCEGQNRSQPTSVFSGFVAGLNEDTGDIVGIWWAPDLSQGATRQVIGGQDIKFQYLPGDRPNGFVGGADFASAATFQVPKRKPATFELTLG